MTDDQQFILGCLTLILPTVASVLAYRKTDQTHQAVNGMQVKAINKARAQGRSTGARAERGAEAIRLAQRRPSPPVQEAPEHTEQHRAGWPESP